MAQVPLKTRRNMHLHSEQGSKDPIGIGNPKTSLAVVH